MKKGATSKKGVKAVYHSVLNRTMVKYLSIFLLDTSLVNILTNKTILANVQN